MTQPPQDNVPPPEPGESGPPSLPPRSDYPPPAPTSSFPAAPEPQPGYGYGTVAPGGVPPTMWQDSESGLVLPQGTQLASIGRRIGSYFLGILLAIVTLGIGYVIWGLIVWARGQTPAKQVLGMRTWRPETRLVAGFWWMALREVIGGFVEGILSIITQLVSFILMVTGKERRCIKDYVAGTVVLYDPNKALAAKR